MFGRETPAAGGPAAPASAPVGADDRAVRTGARGGASQVPANPHDADSVDDAPWGGRKSLSRRVRKRVSLRVRLDTFSGHRIASTHVAACRAKTGGSHPVAPDRVSVVVDDVEEHQGVSQTNVKTKQSISGIL